MKALQSISFHHFYFYLLQCNKRKLGREQCCKQGTEVSQLTCISTLDLYKTLLSQTSFCSSVSTGYGSRSCFPKMTNTADVQRYRMWLGFLLPSQQIRESKVVVLQRRKKSSSAFNTCQNTAETILFRKLTLLKIMEALIFKIHWLC